MYKSYLFISFGYLLRCYQGNVSCEGELLRHSHYKLDSCFLVFGLLYYFGVAGGAWWLNLSFSWFLAAGCKWGSEAIAKKWVYFHGNGWLPPLILTLYAWKSAGGVEGDPVSGICFLAGRNIYYFVVPMTIFILLGAFFLFWGFLPIE